MTKKATVFVSIIVAALCWYSSGAMAQSQMLVFPTNEAPTEPWAQAVYPKGYTGNRTLAFGSGPGTLPKPVVVNESGSAGIFTGEPGQPIDPLNPVSSNVFGPEGSLYDWIFSPDDGIYHSPLCPWKQ